MKIIIAGAGKVGSAVARTLSAEGHDIAVVDKDSGVISYVSDEMDVICVEGSATSPDTLETAEIKSADVIIAATEMDEVNMISAITAKKMGARYAIARIREPEYYETAEFLRSMLGIDLVVNPEYECAEEISRVLRFPGAARVDAFSAGNVEIVEYRVPEGSGLDGMALKLIPQAFKAKILVAVIERGGEAIIPDGEFVLKAGDKLSITGGSKELRKFFGAIKAYKKPVKSVMIMGGGKIAVYLSRILIETGISVTIIDKDEARCNALCDLVPGAKIINGDATHSDTLREEGLRTTDAFVALTGDDGDNIITSLYVKGVNSGKIVTKINRVHFSGMLSNSGLDSVVIPKEIVARHITRYVRALDNSIGGSMETLHKLADGRVEAMEFKVNEGAGCIGVPLKDLKIKKGMLLTSVVHKNVSQLPGGSTVIEPGDVVVVVAKSGQLKNLDALIEDNR